jgi:hypothetical protein
MAQTINWVEPENQNVGSVLIYRADNNKLDSLGSRTVINTIAAQSGGSWVVQYSDASGNEDHVYRVQFWDGVGSSQLSDAIGQDYSELLCGFDEVIRVARMRHFDGVGSSEVYEAIQDATDYIFENYGDPVKKSVFYLDSETGIKGQSYNFTGDMKPVHQVRRVLVSSVDTDIVPSSVYDVDFTNGNIRFTDSFIGSYQGQNIYVHWVPKIYNIFAKNMAAVNLLEGELLMAGVDVSNPKIARLKEKVDEIKDSLRPKGIYNAKQAYGAEGYDVIPQAIDRTSIYFNH